MQATPLSPNQMMLRGALVGLGLAALATGPSLVSAGFAMAQVLMAVPLAVAFMALCAGLASFFLLD